MKKLAVVFSALAILVLYSCKKNTNSSPSSYLEGSWMISKIYADTTGLGNMNTAQVTTFTSSVENTYVFNSNGSYFFPDLIGILGKFSWALVDNNTYLAITTSPSDIAYHKILMLTPTTLELEDTASGRLGNPIIVWTFYSKL